MKGVANYVAAAVHHNDDLVLQHALLVKRIASHLMLKLPDTVQIDDLVQAGLIGLLDATRHYRETGGASFETYAGIRIRGAILDEIRKNNWAPRSVYRKARMISGAVRELENQLGRSAADQEIAQALNMTIEDYHQLLSESNSHVLFSLENSLEREQVSGRDDPLGQVEKGAFREALAEKIKTLPDREQTILSLYYEEELTLREIGEIMGVSESRVSQIHAQAAHRLRARLQDWV
ncbi:MAG TPA: RNA polymerase sigma factor FliA [Gammaproteobacteria bacterium]|nr:RNA polymerase sigma factor FliA [Gammaproteobacteria bacterium]